VAAYLRDRPPGAAPVAVQLVTPIGSWVIDITADATDVREGTADVADLVLEGHPQLILGVLSGSHTLDGARSRGLSVSGDTALLATFPLVPG
jgi:hypothetical protein